MSLWCGNCEQEIFEGFGLLYRLQRDDEGKLRYRDESVGYIPPNSAICDHCWANMPKDQQLSVEVARAVAESGEGTVYAYVPADSNNDPFWKSKTWSGIVANEAAIVYLSTELVTRLF